MENYNKINEARKLFYSNYFGVLSTLSQEEGLEGFPFGSLTPYSIDKNGNAIILISDIAEHTRNINKDSRISLTVVQAKSGEVQAQGRITYLAHAKRISDNEFDEVSADYLKLFPEASGYFQAHMFYFYRLEFLRARFIGGFGKIFWLEPDEFLYTKPFSIEEEQRMLSHMNQDHQDALALYLKKYHNIKVEESDTMELVRVFHDSCDIKLNQNLYNVRFPNIIEKAEDAREAFKSMM